MARLVVQSGTRLARAYSTKLDQYYDMIIVGGGMVGNTMACAFGMSSLRNTVSFDCSHISVVRL